MSLVFGGMGQSALGHIPSRVGFIPSWQGLLAGLWTGALE